MIAHAVTLAGMFVAATALMLYSNSLPPDETGPIIANGTPEPVVTATPAVNVTPTPATGTPAASATPGANPTPKATPEPTPTPTSKPTEAPLLAYNIAASTPQSVLRKAQMHAGRVDPFKSVYPPNLPDFEPAVSPEQLALPDLTSTAPPSLPPVTPQITITGPEATPPPTPLTEGLKLNGIMDGGIDPVAIIEARGVTNLYRIGEIIPQKNVKVVAIDYENGEVIVSRGARSGTLYLPKPKVPNF